MQADHLIVLDTDSWQVNYMAWLTLGKPDRVTVLTTERRVRLEQAREVKKFFRAKNVSARIFPERLKPDNERHNSDVVGDAAREILDDSRVRRLVIFRTGGTKFMSEGALFAFASLVSQEPALADRMWAAGINEEKLVLTGPRGERDQLDVDGSQVTVKDLEAISGYRLQSATLWWDGEGIAEGGSQLSDQLHDQLCEIDNWPLVMDWLRAWAGRRASEPDEQGAFRFNTTNISHRAVVELFELMVGDKIDFQFRGKAEGQTVIPSGALGRVARLLGCSEKSSHIRGFLFEKVIARHLIRRALAAHGNRKRCYLEIKPLLAEGGRELTDIDYFLIDRFGHTKVIECKSSAEALKTQQSEVHLRLARRLTGYDQDVYFMIPATSDRDEKRIRGVVESGYPQELGYHLLVAPLHRPGHFELP